MHISDGDGPPGIKMLAELAENTPVCLDRHWLPGKGIINWPALMGTLEEIGFTGPRTFELIVEDEQREAVWRQASSLAKEWSRQRC